MDEIVASIEENSTMEAMTEVTFVSFGPFTMDERRGLTKQQRSGRGREATIETVWISAPFEVLGACRDPHGRAWGKLLQFYDDDGRPHTKHVTDANLQGEPAALCATLADEGLRINRSKQKELAEYLSGVRIEARVTIVNRTGWHQIGKDHIFVLPGKTITREGSERIVLDASAHGPYETQGTIEDWKEGVGALSADHVLLTFMVSAALAGPLAHIVGAEGGGVHVFGPSSIGKSSLLCAAASVWGRGSSVGGYMRTWRATVNGLEGAAASATDTCLVLDEIGVGDARDVAASIYQLANGVGKARAGRGGELREPKAWRVLPLSSGELPVDAKIDEDRGRKSRGGHLVRLLDIRADREFGFGAFDSSGSFPDAGKLADAIKEAAVSAYGTAGPAFIQELASTDRDVTVTKTKNFMVRFVSKVVSAGASEQINRAAKKFALIAAAGEMASAVGITPWTKGSAERAAVSAFKAWLDKRGGVGSHEERQAVEQVRRMIIQHGESRFEQVSEVEGSNLGGVHNRLGWRKGEGAAREWWIPSEVWKADFCDGLDPTHVAKTLASKGMLRRQDAKNLTAVRKIGGRNARVYVLAASILGGEDG
jgi:uncharacterized protein (DUF927 family)